MQIFLLLSCAHRVGATINSVYFQEYYLVLALLVYNPALALPA
jgi:hypothetical protein